MYTHMFSMHTWRNNQTHKVQSRSGHGMFILHLLFKILGILMVQLPLLSRLLHLQIASLIRPQCMCATPPLFHLQMSMSQRIMAHKRHKEEAHEIVDALLVPIARLVLGSSRLCVRHPTLAELAPITRLGYPILRHDETQR